LWRPIEYTGSYGDNGFYMKFDPSATNGIGHDHSGNGNHFSPSGFVTTGTGTDVMSDTPTKNFATFNPLVPGPSGFSDGNLSVTANSSSSVNRGTPNPTFKMPSSGKFYAEFTPTSLGEIAVALTQEGNGDTVISYYKAGTISLEGSGTVGNASPFTTGDVIGVAVDVDNTTARFYKNAFKQGSSSGSCAATANYGQREFAYPPGTASATDYFNCVTYTGNNSTNAITGVGFAPDLVWIKPRSTADHHRLNDTLRGVNKTLSSNLTNAEYGPVNAYLDSFDSDGFTVSTSDLGWNNSSHTYVAWCWKAGGTASSNTDGSITASVSANQDAGFSIVSYTGNGSTGTVGHGLNDAPNMILCKNRDNTAHWFVYHSSLATNKALRTSANIAAFTASPAGINAASSSTFTLGGARDETNTNNEDYIAYCWHSV
jgi:hypothetical protein